VKRFLTDIYQSPWHGQILFQKARKLIKYLRTESQLALSRRLMCRMLVGLYNLYIYSTLQPAGNNTQPKVPNGIVISRP